jgi:hypothetical protein
MTTAEATKENFCSDTGKNVVDAIGKLSEAAFSIREAVSPTAVPWEDGDGGYVSSLVEAAIYVGKSIRKVATAIESLAEAVRESGRNPT